MFVSQVNAHQRVISVKDDYNNQVDGMPHFVITSLSPVTVVVIQRAHH